MIGEIESLTAWRWMVSLNVTAT